MTEDSEILAERLRIMHRPRIFRYVSGRALGDIWTLTQWLLRRSEETGQPAILSRQLGPQPDGHDDVFELIPRIAALLDSTGTIQFTDEPGEDPPIAGPSLWGPRVVYMPVKKLWRWKDGWSTAVFQLDGRSGADAKNPSAEDAYRLIEAARGSDTMLIGLPMHLEASVYWLSRCRFFVGVCSGMSHVAHSVGCPTILIRYRLQFERWHPDPKGPNPWTLAEGTDNAIEKIKTIIRKYE